ncbi:hypothetical protein [Streptomyces sp. NPDC057284]|uniref:hypothetical protein n=1 Tax=Streptomyces sp. NPDC057284 TaxID=3346083 RepID=UPI00362D18B9
MHDVFLARPRAWRNQVWEANHVQAPVLVDVDGVVRRRRCGYGVGVVAAGSR